MRMLLSMHLCRAAQAKVEPADKTNSSDLASKELSLPPAHSSK